MGAYGIESLGLNNQSKNENVEDIKLDLSGKSLLLVEDNETNQEVAMGMMEPFNVEIIVANHGQEALDRLKERKFDLVLMDMQMPIMDGITATENIRKNPEYDSLPIVAMTANAMASDVQNCKQAGMNDHIGKPIDFNILKDKLREYILGANSITLEAVSVYQEAEPVEENKSDIEGINIELTMEDIPGVDTVLGISRIGGNSTKYWEILERFVTAQIEAMINLKQAMIIKDIDTATRTAHSLRGAAANLAATTLSDMAKEMEDSLNNNIYPEDIKVNIVIEHLNTLKKHIDTLKIQKPVDTLQAVNVESNSQQENLSLTTLLDMIDNYDTQALEEVNRVQHSLKNSLVDFEALKRAIENFDFDKAKTLTEKLTG